MTDAILHTALLLSIFVALVVVIYVGNAWRN